MGIGDNVRLVRDSIARACRAAGRSPEEVSLVAVSKTAEPGMVAEAVDCGIAALGENWVQEAAGKRPAVERLTAARASWHMIGHLQSNKVKKALGTFDYVQSVDSLHLAQELDRRAAGVGRRVPILLEVNTSGESSKFGTAPDAASQLARGLLGLPGLELRGLMTIGPGLSVGDPEKSRHCFAVLRTLRDRLQDEFSAALPVLSMGMSSDYVVAIQEGSTMLRIGTAIFGGRPKG